MILDQLDVRMCLRFGAVARDFDRIAKTWYHPLKRDNPAMRRVQHHSCRTELRPRVQVSLARNPPSPLG